MVIGRTTEAKTTFYFLRDANQLVLNCKIFSYFRPLTFDMITQNTNHSNTMYLHRSHSASTSLGKVEGLDEESNKIRHRKEGVQSKK